MEKTRTDYITLAKKQVGVTSGDKYRDYYNKTVGFIGSEKWPYCAAGLTWLAGQTGLTKNDHPFTASAPTMLQWYKNKGRYHARGTNTPQPGDTIIFKWLDNYESSASHVGTVEYTEGSTVHTIEFNSTGGNVVRKTWAANNVCIVGYGVPYFKAESAPAPNPSQPTVNSAPGKSTIKAVQAWVNKEYGTRAAVDGVWGSQTKSALVGALQCYLNGAYKAGLVVDGVFGAKTRAAIRVLRKGTKGDYVRILQGLLICRGLSTNGFDGDFGSGTEAAVKSYQKSVKITVDGEAGKDTFTKLCS